MGVKVEVGLYDASLEAKLEEAPRELLSAIYEATIKATDAVADAVHEATPERTGRLAFSIVSKVDRTSDGAVGQVSSNLRYARFVEFGTREHGRAQRMFQRGLRAEQARIDEFYQSAVERVVVSLK